MPLIRHASPLILAAMLAPLACGKSNVQTPPPDIQSPPPDVQMPPPNVQPTTDHRDRDRDRDRDRLRGRSLGRHDRPFKPVAGARHLVELLSQGDFRTAVKRYYRYHRSHMLPHRPAVHLRMFWDRLTRRFGSLQRIEDVRALPLTQGRIHSVKIRCRFEQGQVTLELRYVPDSGRVLRFLDRPIVTT